MNTISLFNSKSVTRWAALLAILAFSGLAGTAASANASTISLGSKTVTLVSSTSSDDGTPPKGSYFRLYDNATSTYLDNSSSNNGAGNPDDTWTRLVPGTGGLKLGKFQTPASGVIVTPQAFDGANFDIYTDSWSGTYSAPSLSYDSVTDDVVSSDLNAWSVSWAAATPPPLFNQGAASGSGGNNKDLTGTYNPGSKIITLDWTSTITDPPGFTSGFNGDTGVWHIVAKVS